MGTYLKYAHRQFDPFLHGCHSGNFNRPAILVFFSWSSIYTVFMIEYEILCIDLAPVDNDRVSSFAFRCMTAPFTILKILLAEFFCINRHRSTINQSVENFRTLNVMQALNVTY